MYIGTNIFSIKQERNTYNYNLCFFNFSRGHYDYPSNILSVFPPPSPSTSAGLESEKVTHTFIAERSRPFVILPRLSCSYPVLSLRRRCVKKKKKTKTCLKLSPTLHTRPFWSPQRNSGPNPHWYPGSIAPVDILDYWLKDMRSPKDQG